MSSSRPQHRSVWRGARTSTKIVLALLATAAISIVTIASSDATVTPVAQSSGTATPAPTPVIAGPPSTPNPTAVVPQDVFIPGRLMYVKGRAIYLLHQYDEPIPVAYGAQPSISPDGNRLAYIYFYKNYQNLMTVDIRSGKTKLLLNNTLTNPIDASTGRTAATPAWSDDGKFVYFAWSYPGSPWSPDSTVQWKTDLSITQCAAGGPCDDASAKTLTEPKFESSGDSEPAPRLADPNFLVYTRWQYQTARDGTSRALAGLQALNLSTSAQVTLTATLDNVSEPVWSPNGRYLAFVKSSDDLQSTSIWIMPFHPPGRITDYGKARLLVKGAPFAEHPVFSPDGKYMAYIASGPDGRLHLFVAQITFGPSAHIDNSKMVQRSDIVDGDSLVWTS